MWDDILAEPRPAAELHYTTGIWHRARGLAYLRLGQADAATQGHGQFDAIARTDAMNEVTRASFPKAATMLEIAGHVLAGELAAERGEPDEAIGRSRAALTVQDGLAYVKNRSPPATCAGGLLVVRL